ncbi:MAG TPA: GNAT family N-acetyltransferase [Xanthomonadales bacterium]|nr:GNAT family N-acetyltransferase [Xanthomonadales bacterium]
MIHTLTSESQCRDAWQALSPRQRAWDEWDLMFAFHDEERFQFHFLTHERGGQIDGLIPLVENLVEKRFELFGGSYPDGRVLWLRPDDFPRFYEQLPENTVFFDLSGPWVDGLLNTVSEYTENFTEQDDRFFLIPAKFDHDFVNHINTFSTDKRKGFLYDLRKIREKGPVLHWSDEDASDLFIRLSNLRFGAESDYADESNQAELRRVIRELKAHNNLRTLVIEMDGQPHAVSMTAHYGKSMVALYSASNMEYKNLGKLLNVETIQEACRLRVDEISYMTGMTWKAAWKMDNEPCRTFRKPARPPALPASPENSNP